jgi:hypothetical protein
MKKQEPSFNIITFGKKADNFLISAQEGVIGTFLTTTPQYLQKGSIVFLHCRSLIWGIAKINSDYIYDEKIIWKDKVYPHRFRIEVLKMTTNPLSLVQEHYNDRFRESFGTGWAFKFIFAPKPLPASIGKDIYEDLSNREDASLEAVFSMLDKLAKKKR